MYTKDTVTRVIYEPESGAVIPLVKREYFNDDGTVEFTRTLDEAAGLRLNVDHKELVEEAQAFLDNHVLPAVREKIGSDQCTTRDGVAEVDKLIAAKVAEEAKEAEPKPGLDV